MRLSRNLLAGFAMTVAVAGGQLLLCIGCSSDPAPGGGDPTSDAGTEDRRARPPSPAADATEPIPDPPEGLVPKGWELYPDYDPTCGFYVPSAPEYMPPPIRWEPCSIIAGDAGLSGPPGIDCRRAAPDWRPAPDEMSMIISGVGKSTDGRLLFAQTRIYPKGKREEVVVEADGPVHQALMTVGRCFFARNSIHQTSVVYTVHDEKGGVAPQGGSLGGDVYSRLRVLVPKGYKANDVFAHEFIAGATTFAENNGTNDQLRRFTDGSILEGISNGEDSDLFQSNYQFWQDDLFWNASWTTRRLIKAKPPGAPSRTLIGHGNDWTRAVDGFATDGVDMVWTEASGRTDASSQTYATFETWTAKYTTDPAVLESTKRRVRSADPKSWANPRVVGCGYAAHFIFGPGRYQPQPWQQRGFRLIRLSDGRTWDVLSSNEAQTYSYGLENPLAITCDEVFVEALIGSYSSLARIRIDSLGPGSPPD